MYFILPDIEISIVDVFITFITHLVCMIATVHSGDGI